MLGLAQFEHILPTGTLTIFEDSAVPSSIPIQDTNSIASLQRSDVSSETSSDLSYSQNTKTSKDPPGTTMYSNSGNATNKPSVYAQLKDTKASIEKWVTTKIEQVQQTVSLRITSEINRMISLITTTSQKLNNKIERQAKNVNVFYHRVDDMNITDLEEAMLETKITTLKSSLQEDMQTILDQQKEAFNSEIIELKKNLDNTNNRYRYLLQENYELRKEITMFQEKDEPSGNEHVEAVIQQVKDLTEMIYQIKKLQTEHSYKIKDTKSVLGTSMEQAQNATDKVKNFQHMVDSLDDRINRVHHNKIVRVSNKGYCQQFGRAANLYKK